LVDTSRPAGLLKKRIAAVIANDGVCDYGAAKLSAVPAEQRAAMAQAVRAKEAPQIDRMLEAAMKNSPTAAWALTHGMFVTGTSTPRAYIAATLDDHLRDGMPHLP
jgi:hypothetical protein